MANEKAYLNVALSELNKEDKYKVVFINGKRIQIQKNKDVMVNKIVKDVIQESDENRLKGNTQENLLVL